MKEDVRFLVIKGIGAVKKDRLIEIIEKFFSKP